jgi:hypothetical protein
MNVSRILQKLTVCAEMQTVTNHRLGHVRRATEEVRDWVLQGLGVGGAEDGAVEKDSKLYAWVLANRRLVDQCQRCTSVYLGPLESLTASSPPQDCPATTSLLVSISPHCLAAGFDITCHALELSQVTRFPKTYTQSIDLVNSLSVVNPVTPPLIGPFATIMNPWLASSLWKFANILHSI